MKKYILLSFLFLIATQPILAKSANAPNNNPGTTSQNNSQNISVSPTGNQVKNQNEIQVQNQGEEKQINTGTQESERLSEGEGQDFEKVSDQVLQIIETVGAKGGIGQEVREIAQNQSKIQNEIKSSVGKLESRSGLAKFFIGSDKKQIQTLQQNMEQDRLMIQQLEQLMLRTENEGEKQQLQQTIDLMLYQNTSLQEKINNETKYKGMFGWLLNIFN